MKVGVAILLSSPQGFPMYLRDGTDLCKDTWCLPGGSVEDGESLQEAALRELAEETGVSDVTSIRRVSFTSEDDFGSLGKYLTVFFYAETPETPVIAEPHKAKDMVFVSMRPENDPVNLFPGTGEFLKWVRGSSIYGS